MWTQDKGKKDEIASFAIPVSKEMFNCFVLSLNLHNNQVMMIGMPKFIHF
jgi:hypothetical protein